MWDAHGFDGCRDGPRVDERHVLASAGERDVRAERFPIERGVSTCELGADPLPQSEHGRGARADPKPHDTRLSGRREAARVVDLDIERGDVARGRLDRDRDVSETLDGCLAKEGERHVHQLRFHATQRGKIRRAAERRLGDLGGEWERDEEPYTRRLEPDGLRLVRNKLGDEHHSEKTAEACERGHAKTLTLRDAFPCVGDQGSHCGTFLSKQRAACSSPKRVTRTSQTALTGRLRRFNDD